MRYTARRFVAERLLGLFDSERSAVAGADFSTGLIVPLPIGALVCAGVYRGYVTVTVEVLEKAPDRIDEGPWDDIAEASVRSTQGHLSVTALEDPHGLGSEELPVLSAHGPGDYRVRVHARGRDCNPDEIVEDSTEVYLITAWVAAPLPTLIIRATDARGQGLRLSDLARRAGTETAVPVLVEESLPQRKALIEESLRGGRRDVVAYKEES